MQYRSKVGLRQHVIYKHDDKSFYKCETFGKDYKSKEGLNLHIKGIHGKDFIKCHVLCNKSMVNNCRVKVHIARVHEKKKIHACDTCDRGHSIITWTR